MPNLLPDQVEENHNADVPHQLDSGQETDHEREREVDVVHRRMISTEGTSKPGRKPSA
jgi:hypothetical protein